MYVNMAAVYDRLSDVDYTNWADFLEGVFAQNGVSPGSRVMDLACGTGSMTLELAKRGYKVSGVDLSAEMLTVAEEKLRPFAVPLYRADMRSMPNFGQFDTVVCLCDSLNYLSNVPELRTVLSGLQAMKPRLLIFDLNTTYYLAEVLGNNFFHHVDEEVAYIWENSYDSEANLCEMDITFFLRQKGNLYTRFEEVHHERAFSLTEVNEVLGQTGWELVQVFNGYRAESAKPDSWRWLFVARPAVGT